MAQEALPLQSGAQPAVKEKSSSSPLIRVAKYMAVRLISLFFTVVVGVFLTIIIANMGGYVDTIQRAAIQEDVGNQLRNDPSFKTLSVDVKRQRMEEMVKLQEKRMGLDQPFMLRTTRFLTNALTLDLGRAINMVSDSGSKQVRLIILERLPPTLLLFGASNLILFFLALFIALSLSRRYGSFWDKLIVALAPSSSAPGWFYGIFLILIFSSLLKWLPFGGMVDAPPPDTLAAYSLSLLRHLILPTVAITLSTIFLSAYSWRTYFLIYSSEDYVEMAKAKGLTSKDLERRYILRPTLPTIITTFALTLISLWTGAPIFETIFNWPGLGRALYSAIGAYDTPVIVGETVIFAYLLAITVFILDFVYVLVDPRVKIGSEGKRS